MSDVILLSAENVLMLGSGWHFECDNDPEGEQAANAMCGGV